jgi:hypothetical protein
MDSTRLPDAPCARCGDPSRSRGRARRGSAFERPGEIFCNRCYKKLRCHYQRERPAPCIALPQPETRPLPYRERVRRDAREIGQMIRGRASA